MEYYTRTTLKWNTVDSCHGAIKIQSLHWSFVEVGKQVLQSMREHHDDTTSIRLGVIRTRNLLSLTPQLLEVLG
jgi:hypothetical protein